MAQEIGRALQFFFTSTPYNKVDHILLAGGSAALPGFTEAVTHQTSFACMVINPLMPWSWHPRCRRGRLPVNHRPI
jgi:type IV pilus assembly protein PilM